MYQVSTNKLLIIQSKGGFLYLADVLFRDYGVTCVSLITTQNNKQTKRQRLSFSPGNSKLETNKITTFL